MTRSRKPLGDIDIRDTPSRNTRSTAGKTSVVPKKTNSSPPRRGAKKKNNIDCTAETGTRPPQRTEQVVALSDDMSIDEASVVRPSPHSSSSEVIAESNDVRMSIDEPTDAGPPLQPSPIGAVGDVNIPNAVNETALTHDSSTPHDSSMVDDESIVDIAVAGSDSAVVDDVIPSLTPPDSLLKQYYPERGSHTDAIDEKFAVRAAVEATAANEVATFVALDYTAQVNVDMDEDTFAKFVAVRAVGDAKAATALDHNVQANVFMDDDDPALAAWAGFPGPPV
jgi:hypothetical protein